MTDSAVQQCSTWARAPVSWRRTSRRRTPAWSSPALLDDAYNRWHERRAKELGTTDAGWEHAVQSMRHDRTASVEHQLTWLREAGFADADVLWKDHRLAVLAARRAG
jgi:hypothetical protein